MNLNREFIMQLFTRMKPFVAVVFLQFGLAGMDIYTKVALNEGMSPYVFVVYRHAVATLVIAPFAVFFERTKRPKMTISMFFKFALLALLEPVVGQILYTLGLKDTTATFAAAMTNILPAITFIMAWIFGLEKMNFSSKRTQAKVIGTIATIAGAMIMTFVKGPIIDLLGKTKTINHADQDGSAGHNVIKGSLFITIGLFSWACFMILQAVTLKTYPTELSLTAWICLFGTGEGAIVALFMERRNYAAWAIKFDNKLIAAVYTGIFCSGLAYYIQGVIMRQRGPVFVTAFSPLNMVIVAILGALIMSELLFLGSFIGAIVIVVGLYLVIWGKSKDYDKSSSQPASVDENIAQENEMINKSATDDMTILQSPV